MLTKEQIAERRKNKIEPFTQGDKETGWKQAADFYNRTSGMQVDAYGRVLVEIKNNDGNAFVVAQYSHKDGWTPRRFEHGEGADAFEQFLPSIPRHQVRTMKMNYYKPNCTGQTTRAEPACLDADYIEPSKSKINEDGTRTITNGVGMRVLGFPNAVKPVLYLDEREWEMQAETKIIRNGRGIEWEPKSTKGYDQFSDDRRTRTPVGLPENDEVSTARTGFTPLTFQSIGMTPPKDSDGNMVDPWNPIDGYGGTGQFYTHTTGFDANGETKKVVLAGKENDSGSQAWQNGDLSYTGSEKAKLVFTGIWRTFVDPLGSVIDLARGDYQKRTLGYGLEDFVLDAGLDLMFPGGVIKGGITFSGKQFAKVLERFGAKSAADLVEEGAQRSIKLIEQYDKVVARIDEQIGETGLKIGTEETEEALAKKALTAARNEELKETVQALDGIEAYQNMPALRTNEEKVAGFISKNVYGDLEKRPNKIGDFILRGDLSTAETSVYVNDKTKELFFGMRGSKTARDWYQTDVAISLNLQQFESRFNRTEKEFLRVHEIYPEYKMNTTGHSLAGGLNYYLAGKYAKEAWFGKAIGFNAASSPLGETVEALWGQAGLVSKEAEDAMNKKIINIRQGMDIVSVSGFKYGETKTFISPTGFNPGTAHPMNVFYDQNYLQVKNPKRFSQLMKIRFVKEGWKITAGETGQAGVEGALDDDDGGAFDDFQITNSSGETVEASFDFQYNTDGEPIDFTVNGIGNDGVDYTEQQIDLGGGLCPIVLGGGDSFVFDSNPYQSQAQKRQLVEADASVEINQMIPHESVASGSLVAHTYDGHDMICKYSSPAQCTMGHTIQDGGCDDIAHSSDVVDGVIPPIEPTETTEQETTEQQTTMKMPKQKQQSNTTLFENLKKNNAPIVGYIMYAESQKQKIAYNFIVF